jgi:hypothetical protein
MAAVVARVDGSRVAVSWSPPKADGGAEVSRYSVQWSTDMTFDGDSGLAFVDAHSTAADDSSAENRLSFIIEGLQAGSPHYVRVLAYNRIGYSQPAIARPLGTNDEIQAVVVAVPKNHMQSGVLNGTKVANFTLNYTDPSTGE